MARYVRGGIDIERLNLISDEINAAPTDRHLEGREKWDFLTRY